ncbi:two-component system response regulator [Roseofilum casamattae]|uniref:EAL domain-containing protein n=1 Tax=Roseofilum casamattae BLCC-M143 TaxID=3022442 RepID=A0ABT7BYL1_9CYAN|nr:EAL domain-containing response regulator [Roseofilum casamattae]MDJ1183589.1 EAL domain-containing protein [Roseofilum casamattae BLCC-M143]
MVNLTDSPSGPILIVDDNTNNLRVLFNFLRSSGFKVLVATDGRNALEKIAQTTPDLVLLDVMMPDMSGFEVCRVLQSHSETQDIPIIFMTALSDNEDKVRGLNLGAVDYITKPFYQEEVLSRVRLHLKLRHLNQNLQEKNKQLESEVRSRKLAEQQLKELNEYLESRVAYRTEQLSAALEELKVREEQLSYEASHDHLTGLFNRLWVTQYLSALLDSSISQPASENYAIFFLNLSRFKRVNDRLGHRIGDEVLKTIAQRLGECWKGRGYVARLSGDKFLTILENYDEHLSLENFAERVLEQLRSPIVIRHYHLSISAHIGIIPSLLGYQKMTDILRDADIVMSELKRSGTASYCILDPTLQSRALERIQLEAELPIAIEQQQFELYYQPILSLQNDRLIGFESLIRWQHPEQGLLSPFFFIELAEETGYIEEIGSIVIELSCQQLQQWNQSFNLGDPLVMNVNVSPLQLQNKQIIEILQSIGDRYGVSPQQLKLEVTESAFLEDDNSSIEVLEAIHHQGIKLCIDDFGTGYSSLSRLSSFPVNTLKIDRCFVQQLKSPEGVAIIQTIVSLAHYLGIDLVAEGIETMEQLESLKTLGCEFGQGYWFAKPMNSLDATEWIRNYGNTSIS